MGEIGKKRGKEQSVTERGKMKKCSKARENPERGNFAKVELLVGSGTLCVSANILLSVHRSNTVVHQSVVEN